MPQYVGTGLPEESITISQILAWERLCLAQRGSEGFKLPEGDATPVFGLGGVVGVFSYIWGQKVNKCLNKRVSEVRCSPAEGR